MDKYSYVANAHGSYIDQMYNDYHTDNNSVDESWQKFFEGFDFAIAKYGEDGVGSDSLNEKEIQVHYLIHAYRSRAHLRANTNPVRTRKDRGPRLDLEDFGLSQKDLETEFEAINNTLSSQHKETKTAESKKQPKNKTNPKTKKETPKKTTKKSTRS